MADGPAQGAGARRCCFADAVGERVAGCAQAEKGTRRHRRTVFCRSGEAQGVCAAWLDQVRRSARFTLGASQTPSALPRRAARGLQCGGLLGMNQVLEDRPDAQGRSRIQDVSALLRRALVRFGSFDRVPMQTVVQKVHELNRDDRSRR